MTHDSLASRGNPRRRLRWRTAAAVATAVSALAIVAPASPAAADTTVPGVGVYGPVYIGDTSKVQYFSLWWAPCAGGSYLWEFRVAWHLTVASTGVTVTGLDIRTTNWSPLEMAYVQKTIVGKNLTYNIQPNVELLGITSGGIDNGEYRFSAKTLNWFDAPNSNVYFHLRIQVECPVNSINPVENHMVAFQLDRGKYYVDTFATANGYDTPYSTTSRGTLYSGTSYVYCKAWGRQIGSGSAYNHWWMLTDLDTGSDWRNKYVSAYYLSRWGNDEAKDNSGRVLPNC